MSIINILYKTLILLVWSIIQVFGVLIEGIYKLFGAVVKYLELAQHKLGKVYTEEKVYKGKYTA